MILLADLPLVTCSEIMQPVSISDSAKLGTTKSDTFIAKYKKRPEDMEHYSLAEYFHELKNNNTTKKEIFPHFVGMRSNPIFPPTISYAKSTLIINKPWRDTKHIHQQSDNDIMGHFLQFIASDSCPVSVKAAYIRAKSRYEENREFEEHADTDMNYEGKECELEKEDIDLIHIVNTLTSTDKTIDIMGYDIDRGIMYNWPQKIYKVSNSIYVSTYQYDYQL